MNRIIEPAVSINGEMTIPGDKSISHRSVMFGAIAEGTTTVTDFLMSDDCLSTISCFRKLGIEIDLDRNTGSLAVHGRGIHGLEAPSSLLYTGNSGTTTRLLAGILAGQRFPSCLDGDDSIRKRPMNRVITPLRLMGADIHSMENGCTPLSLSPSKLHGITYRSPVASAQVKSCILLAGLCAEGETSVIEPALSRNHTELMLRAFGANVRSEKTGSTQDAAFDRSDSGWMASVKPDPLLHAIEIKVPGDISSAAYFIAAAMILPSSEVLIRNVGINPTRAGILEVVRRMGGKIELLNKRDVCGELTADLLVRSSSLHGTVIEGEMIPTLIDELPICAVLAAYASGKTIIKDAAELKVKESDRIDAMCKALSAMGADVTACADGMIINGGRAIHGAEIDSCKDHRIAMSMTIAALGASGTTAIRDADCVGISYPTFYTDLASLCMK